MPEFDPDAYLNNKGFDPDAYLGIKATDPSDLPPGDIYDPNQRAPRQDRTFGQIAEGVGETALTLGTGATSGAVGFGIGSSQDIIDTLSGKPDRKLRESYAQSGTNLPESEAGQEYVKWISEKLGALPPVMNFGVVGGAAARSKPGVSRMIPNGKASQARTIIAKEIDSGNVNAGNIAKTLNAKGELITNPNMKKAISLLGDGDEAHSMAISFEKANDATRLQANKMLDKIQANKLSGDPLDIMENRPAHVVGESLANRVNKLDNIKKSASKTIGNLIKGELGSKKVDVSQARDGFINALKEVDIDIGINDAGALVVNTDRTLTNVKKVIDDDMLNNVLWRLQSGKMKAKEAHSIKRVIREMVDYDPAKPGATKPTKEITDAIKVLSTDLGDSVSKVSGRYKTANKHFSESIDALKEADRVLGRKLMIGDELAEKKFAGLAKRIGTNLTAKEDVQAFLNIVDESLAKRGIRPKDDINRQVAILSDLEKIFKVESAQAPFGFQSRIAQGALEATTMSPTVQAGRYVLDKFRDMGKLEFDDKMKALRALAKPRKARK